MTKVKTDLSSAIAGLDALNGPIRESLARRMGTTGASVFEKEAKRLAPLLKPENILASGDTVNPGRTEGVLRDAIYHAFRDKDSTATVFKYMVSWNATKAGYGHLIEFGHWFTNIITDEKHPTKFLKDKPQWVPAQPFLRPAFDSMQQPSFRAMIQRGRNELPILIAEHAQ